MNVNPTEISALIKQIENQQRNNVAESVMLNCVLGAPTLYINTDAELLHNVLSSLVENAARHTDKGSITFGYDINDDELYFYVKDTGVGMSTALQKEIFDSKSTNADSVLINCKAGAEALGGEIGVESRGPGKGATLWFTIPYNEADMPESTDDAIEPSVEFTHPHTILIADDIDSNYMLTKSILESKYNILHALDGQEAIDMFAKYKVDLILMDISMPVMDGNEATRRIRQTSSDVPIVALTAYAFPTDKQRLCEYGYNAYISKPINIQRLLRIIDQLLPQ